MVDRHDPSSERRLTLGADKAYDTSDFVEAMRQKCVTPHVAQKIKGSAIDGRTTRHAGYGMSQRKRKLVEEAFGWGKTIAGIAKVKVRGLRLVRHAFTIAMAAYNLIRIPRLLAAA
jgi:Transposase DDE domain